MSATSFREMVDAGRYVPVAETSNRRFCVVYSKTDDRCFVVVQDIANWAVITVLPLAMWNNGDLSESSPPAQEARRLALEPRSRPPKRENTGYQSQHRARLLRRKR